MPIVPLAESGTIQTIAPMNFLTPYRIVRAITISMGMLLATATVVVGFETGDVGILIESNISSSLALAVALHPSDDVTIRPELWTLFSSEVVDYEREQSETVVDYDFRAGVGLGVYFNLYDQDELIVFFGPHATYLLQYDIALNSLNVNDRSNYVLIGHIVSAGPLLGATYMLDEQFGITANVKIDASFQITGVNYRSIQYSDYVYTDFEINTLRGNIGLLFYPQ